MLVVVLRNTKVNWKLIWLVGGGGGMFVFFVWRRVLFSFFVVGLFVWDYFGVFLINKKNKISLWSRLRTAKKRV